MTMPASAMPRCWRIGARVGLCSSAHRTAACRVSTWIGGSTEPRSGAIHRRAQARAAALAQANQAHQPTATMRFGACRVISLDFPITAIVRATGRQINPESRGPTAGAAQNLRWCRPIPYLLYRPALPGKPAGLKSGATATADGGRPCVKGELASRRKMTNSPAGRIVMVEFAGIRWGLFRQPTGQGAT